MSFQSNRHFRLWDYKVSHDQLLLRSPTSPDQADNIDVVFIGVRKLALPTLIRSGLEISATAPPTTGLGRSRIFRITADGQQYSIVALACYVFRNRLDHLDSILELLTGDGLTEEMGEVLYRSTQPTSLPEVAGHASE